MSSSNPADDKIEALVGLVLQAVDQRMAVVRDQLAEVANTVARNQIEMQDQIAECRELISRVGAFSGGGATAVAGSEADAAASAALLQAANLLTERVAIFESRLQEYTDERVDELRSIVDRMASQPAAATGSAFTSSAGLSPVVAQLGSLKSPGRQATNGHGTSAPASTGQTPLVAPISRPFAVVTPISEPVAAVAAVARAKPATTAAAAAPAAPAAPAPAPAVQPAVEFDIDAFSAQLNARLSALVEKAIGV